jgi:hypothetical protein
MEPARSDDDSVLVLRLSVTPDGGVLVRVIAVSPSSEDRNLGNVTSSAAAAALVRGWIDAAIESVSPREPPRGQ